MRLKTSARAVLALTLPAALGAGMLAPQALAAAPPGKTPVAVGTGGAVSTVDPDATRIGLDVLRHGGNAVDAAVAAAAALGVTEPYSAGLGGGGYFVYYNPSTRRVITIDGREKAPDAMNVHSFTENGEAIPFDEAVTSGLSVGVPGTPATWDLALKQFGRRTLAQVLDGPARLAQQGFVVDTTFKQQTTDNAARFATFPATRRLFLPGGKPPPVGTVLRNPDLAATYREISRLGMNVFYTGDVGRDVAGAARRPQVVAGSTRTVRPGLLTVRDLANYSARLQAPTHVRYRDRDVYSMGPSSSGGTTVGEALNILERSDLASLTHTQAMHRYLEASAIAFADRNRWVGDPRYVDVPAGQLLSQAYADERACLIDPSRALPKPIAAGSPDGTYAGCPVGGPAAPTAHEGTSTTSLVTADKWGGVVSYTLTIEQTGGSGIVVPNRGFLLNNELTDFNFTDTQGGSDPNLPAPGKRPRSSISPTIVLAGGRPVLAVGSPGGATIITTVLQTLIGRLDLGLTLPQAIAAPRASSRNGVVQAEPAFDTAPLIALGHTFSSTPEIGAAVGLEVLRGGKVLAAAEPVRRGGGSAGVVRRTG